MAAADRSGLFPFVFAIEIVPLTRRANQGHSCILAEIGKQARNRTFGAGFLVCRSCPSRRSHFAFKSIRTRFEHRTAHWHFAIVKNFLSPRPETAAGFLFSPTRRRSARHGATPSQKHVAPRLKRAAVRTLFFQIAFCRRERPGSNAGAYAEPNATIWPARANAPGPRRGPPPRIFRGYGVRARNDRVVRDLPRIVFGDVDDRLPDLARARRPRHHRDVRGAFMSEPVRTPDRGAGRDTLRNIRSCRRRPLPKSAPSRAVIRGQPSMWHPPIISSGRAIACMSRNFHGGGPIHCIGVSLSAIDQTWSRLARLRLGPESPVARMATGLLCFSEVVCKSRAAAVLVKPARWAVRLSG